MNKQESMAIQREKIAETIPEEVQTLDLLNKDIKSSVLNMLKELKETMDKKETRKIKDEQHENVNKETNQKSNQTKISELKNIITEI